MQLIVVHCTHPEMIHFPIFRYNILSICVTSSIYGHRLTGPFGMTFTLLSNTEIFSAMHFVLRGSYVCCWGGISCRNSTSCRLDKALFVYDGRQPPESLRLATQYTQYIVQQCTVRRPHECAGTCVGGRQERTMGLSPNRL